MKVIFDKYGKIIGTHETDDYWGQGDNNSTYLNVQFYDENNYPIVFTSANIIDVVVERPDGQVSPALLMSKVNDLYSQLTVARLTITNWITEVAGKLKFNVRLKEVDQNETVSLKVTGICYRVIGQAIDPADQTITDAEYEALIAALASKEDVANKSTTMDQYSNTKYPTTKLMYDYILSRITLISTPFSNLAALESEIYNGGGGAFALDGIYSVKIGDGTNYDKALVLISDLGGNHGFHATVFNGSFIEMLTGTVEEGTGHLVVPRTQKKYDLTKIGLANNGTLSGLSTTDKSTLVAAINEIYTFLGSTSGPALVGFDTGTKDVVHCLNEAREMIRQIVSGSIPAGAATHATNATNDEDGNRIKTTYAKLGADHQTFSGKNTFEDNVKINANTYVQNDFSVDGSADMGSLEVENTAKFYGNVIIPIAANDSNPLRKDQFNQFKSDLEDGTEVVAKATGDGSGNTIKTFYGHSIEIISDSTNFQYTFQLKDGNGTVLNQKIIDLPIESLVVNGSYDTVCQKIVLTLQNDSTIDIPVGDLVAGLQTEITSQSPLESDLVSDTNQNHNFVTAGEKAQISTNASDIASLEARMDDYSYAEMVYDAEDESIVVTGIALSYDGSDEELIIIR